MLVFAAYLHTQTKLGRGYAAILKRLIGSKES